ncbi:MAG: transporter substrate-binding domain-containing protein [Alphaproteobacteria bacterium]|nr:MAG: transporter substrate-binding domain-containing protein [Alphaproteobacteria bacterium]
MLWCVQISGLLLAMALAVVAPVRADEVTVGGYQFEPFVDGDAGLTPDLIALLNSVQHKHHFNFLTIPSQRRYELMRTGKIDMVMFEMADWGWADEHVEVETTPAILSGHEAFVARRADWDTSQSPADRLKHRMALTLGYHYAFAGYNADQQFLKSRYDVVFAETQTKVLKHLVAGDVDIAIVSDLFLTTAMRTDPTLAAQVMAVSPPDQHYDLAFLTRTPGPVSAAELSGMLDSLKASGQLKAFFEARGLAQFLSY